MSLQTHLFEGFFDDAAVFPPGNSPLDQAIAAHHAHQKANYSALIGPLVIGHGHLGGLKQLQENHGQNLDLSVVSEIGQIADVLDAVAHIPAVTLRCIEARLPEGMLPNEIVPMIKNAAIPDSAQVFVELPRNDTRPKIVEELHGTTVKVKLRTGGIVANLYPDSTELAEALVMLAQHEISYKATAGLHHAIRNTDPDTSFEQHGFLNLFVGTTLAIQGAEVERVRVVLEEREPAVLVKAVQNLEMNVRDQIKSIGTCSITDPLTELIALGLLPIEFREGVRS